MVATAKQLKLLECRPGTQDELVFREVMAENEYRLPEKFEETDLIIDIGGHIGVFAVACLERGAGKVISFEPDLENFHLLEKNIERYGFRAGAMMAAVWKPGVVQVGFSGYPEGMNACGSVVPNVVVGGKNEGRLIIALSIDEIGFYWPGPIRLLKIDAEGSEYSILYGIKSKFLERVQEIVMEVHEWGEMTVEAKVPGFLKYDADGLKEFLEGHGFAVELELLRTYAGNKRALHLFAKKTR